MTCFSFASGELIFSNFTDITAGFCFEKRYLDRVFCSQELVIVSKTCGIQGIFSGEHGRPDLI